MAAAEIMTILFPMEHPVNRVEPEEGSFLSLLTPFPTVEPSVQTGAMALPLLTEEEQAAAVQAAVF